MARLANCPGFAGVSGEATPVAGLDRCQQSTPTGLIGYLRDRKLSRVFLAGLALDFCVRYSAEGARREGFSVAVVEDCCRAIDVNGSLGEARRSFQAIGARSIASEAIA